MHYIHILLYVIDAFSTRVRGARFALTLRGSPRCVCARACARACVCMCELREEVQTLDTAFRGAHKQSLFLRPPLTLPSTQEQGSNTSVPPTPPILLFLFFLLAFHTTVAVQRKCEGFAGGRAPGRYAPPLC
jgi:hypothetical protein